MRNRVLEEEIINTQLHVCVRVHNRGSAVCFRATSASFNQTSRTISPSRAFIFPISPCNHRSLNHCSTSTETSAQSVHNNVPPQNRPFNPADWWWTALIYLFTVTSDDWCIRRIVLESVTVLKRIGVFVTEHLRPVETAGPWTRGLARWCRKVRMRWCLWQRFHTREARHRNALLLMRWKWWDERTWRNVYLQQQINIEHKRGITTKQY